VCGFCCGGTPVEMRGKAHATCTTDCYNAPSRRVRDSALRARVQALADEWERGDLGYPERASVFIRELRATLTDP